MLIENILGQTGLSYVELRDTESFEDDLVPS